MQRTIDPTGENYPQIYFKKRLANLRPLGKKTRKEPGRRNVWRARWRGNRVLEGRLERAKPFAKK